MQIALRVSPGPALRASGLRQRSAERNQKKAARGYGPLARPAASGRSSGSAQPWHAGLGGRSSGSQQQWQAPWQASWQASPGGRSSGSQQRWQDSWWESSQWDSSGGGWWS